VVVVTQNLKIGKMVIKAVEIVRSIRDKYYEETKGFTIDEQILFIKKKSKELQKEIEKDIQHSNLNKGSQNSKI